MFDHLSTQLENVLRKKYCQLVNKNMTKGIVRVIHIFAKVSFIPAKLH